MKVRRDDPVAAEDAALFITVPLESRLSLKQFAQPYGISLSTARREIARGRLAAQLVGGRYYINPLEAERWLLSHPYMARVTNLSRPDQSAVVLNDYDLLVLWRCGIRHNEDHFKPGTARRVARLRAKGFDIAIVPRGGRPPAYRLRDSVEVRWGGRVDRMGPHPDMRSSGSDAACSPCLK